MTTATSTGSRRYRQACDYLAASMIYLRDNVLLRETLRPEHIKPRLLGHWGTCPGITYVYAGLNGFVARTGQRTLLVTGPGHGAPAVHANLWMEGTHALRDPALSLDEAGMTELVTRFSWPGGFPSHLSPHVPGVIHEGGELGYALATAVGAALDDPGLLVACLVGDGEAETGATAASWHATKFLNSRTDGRVLPILHLNGYKISSPTVYGAMSDEELISYFLGAGWSPTIVDVRLAVDPDLELARALDQALAMPRPMLIVRSPKGWGVPSHDAHGTPLAGTFHAHQVPLAEVASDPDQLAVLESWLRSYRPDELFDEHGRPFDDLLQALPPDKLRMGRVPQANGGTLRRDLPLPPLAKHRVDVLHPGGEDASANEALAGWLAELFDSTEDRRDFRIVCPDELESNKLGAVLDVTDRQFTWPVPGYSEHVGPDGRVVEVLSEHLCQGLLQGYLLTGRHGLFPCYEAFATIVDSMVNQYAKFLKMSAEVPWRAPVASLNYLLTSEGWRQEHNGYSHQGPGFINNMLTKKASVARIYLPPDANTLLHTMRHCLAGTGRINVVVAAKQDYPQWLDIDAAEEHCRAGAGVWQWAADDTRPEVVLASAGTVPTLETLAAVTLLRRHAPRLRIRMTNIVDLLALAPPDRHPHGMDIDAFTRCFGTEIPVVVAFHGYPSAMHEVVHGRHAPDRFHVHGYREEGTTTTPFDLLVSNGMSRYDLAADAVRRAWGTNGTAIAEALIAERDSLLRAAYEDGIDPPEITDWRWPT
nr:phosphoketolase family protein [Kibdelosporangium sp. MJ126-NF4]CEL20491.1 Xylulose-5-phosphate phosphoketolase @ Fructose-6-phosphate phosphoketolase [Kibdelosporangium sp. MJ126-NF4]CTQ97715.1 Xylulose-5-phosphate phosphoketolase (EC 4.1.2.9) @ Fructose-6-phosphate phosphoketolase (EC 4.1.2.22) [Kibdelosporangium sp. MJ126-NF4]